MRDIKIGDSFKVAHTTITDLCGSNVSGTGLILHEGMYTELCNVNSWHKSKESYNQLVCLLMPDEIKVTGRVIIKSLK